MKNLASIFSNVKGVGSINNNKKGGSEEMKEWMLKIVMNMVVGSVSVDTIVTFIENFKLDMKKRVEESETPFDDMAFEAFINNEGDILSFIEMLDEMLDEKVKVSVNKLDDALWLGVSEKLKDVIAELQKK